MNTGILGGGLAGLALAAHLDGDREVIEREGRPGGLCRTWFRDGFGMDIGGHILFSKNEEILRTAVGLLGDNVHQRRRNNRILFKGRSVKYPFENGLGELDRQDILECLLGYLQNPHPAPTQFQEWILHTFGEGIAGKYLLPYNRKIWKHPLDDMGLTWVERVPRPPLEDVLKSALGFETEGYTHQLHFFYPRTGGIESLIRALAEKTPVLHSGRTVTRITRRDGGWEVTSVPTPTVVSGPATGDAAGKGPAGSASFDGTPALASASAFASTSTSGPASAHASAPAKAPPAPIPGATGPGPLTRPFDRLVVTIPVTEALDMLDGIPGGVPDTVRRAAAGLRRNRLVVTMLGIRGSGGAGIDEQSAVYIPQEDVLAHRVCTMSYFSPAMAPPGCTSLIGEVTLPAEDPLYDKPDRFFADRMIDDFARLGFLRRDDVVTTLVTRFPYGYVIEDRAYRDNLAIVKDWCGSQGLHLLGRWGEFEYLNMDEVLRRALALARRLQSGDPA